MNRHHNKSPYLKLINLLTSLLTRNKASGYTLAEMIVTTLVLGILIAIAAPRLSQNDPVADSFDQLKNILELSRNRSISTTSAIRILADPDRDNALIVEISETRGCDSRTRLSDGAGTTDKDLRVLSTDGFQVGDEIIVGDDADDNRITAIPAGASVITIGEDLNTSQAADSIVELNNNWRADGAFVQQDLVLDDSNNSVQDDNLVIDATFEDDPTTLVEGWAICFNSRGIASIFDEDFVEQDSITLTVSSTQKNNTNTEEIKVLRGGAIEF